VHPTPATPPGSRPAPTVPARFTPFMPERHGFLAPAQFNASHRVVAVRASQNGGSQ
jgi:hypothetical protein